MIYCFFRLYTVKGALENITYGLPVVEKQNTAVIIGVVCAVILLLIVLAGIIGAIALPAYAAYMKKARFTEVVQEAETVKINMAGCVREHADDDVSKYCINTSGAASGNGWKLQAPNDYSTKYVESIVVSSSDKSGIPEFTITINANPHQFGGNVNMILVSHYKDNSLNWRVSPESSCIDKRLCGSRRY
jgi:Tfp pilus assembly major pilin PilA